MKKIIAVITLLVMLCLCSLPACADDLQSFALQAVRVNNNGELNVIVFEPQEGQLKEDSFSMTLDQTPVPIQLISALKDAETETTWLFVVDLSILGGKRLDKTRAVLKGILLGNGTVLGSKDKAAVFTTGMAAKDIQLTNDSTEIQRQIDALKLDQKNNQLYAQTAAALNYLETGKDVQDRRVLVLISSGTNETSTGMTYEELSGNLQKTKTTVYTFALEDRVDQKKVERYNALARSSVGGRFYEIPANTASVDSAVQELIRNEKRFRCFSANAAAAEIKGKTVSVSRTDNVRVSDSIDLTSDQQVMLSSAVDAVVARKNADEETPTPEPEDQTTETGRETKQETILGLTPVQIGLIAGAAVLMILIIVLIARKSKKKDEEPSPAPAPAPAPYEEPEGKTEPAPQAQAVSSLMVKLDSVGLDEAKTYSSPMVDELVIGRVPNKSRLIVPDPKVSGANSKLTYENRVMYIEDLGSTNGTQLNGMKVTGRVVVHQQDTIRIGQTNLRISWQKVN